MTFLTIVLILALAAAAVLWLRYGKPQSDDISAIRTTLRHPMFELDVDRDSGAITVRARSAMHRTPGDAAKSSAVRRQVNQTLPAFGFRLLTRPETRKAEVPDRRKMARTPDVYTKNSLKSARNPQPQPPIAQVPTGYASVIFQSHRHPLADPASALGQEVEQIEVSHIPQKDADDFQARFGDVAAWIAGMEHELQERLAEDARQRLMAKNKAEATLARLDPACDFPPLHSALDFDGHGQVNWALKMAADARCWIYADGKVFLGSLVGAKVRPLDDGLEVTVRDAKWETSYFSRRKMIVLRGTDPDVLKKWIRHFETRANNIDARGQSLVVLDGNASQEHKKKALEP